MTTPYGKQANAFRDYLIEFAEEHPEIADVQSASDLFKIDGFAVPDGLSLSYFQAGWALNAAKEKLRERRGAEQG